MIFPIGDDNIVGGCKPIVSYTLIVLNVLFWIYELTLGSQEFGWFLNELGSIPNEITSGEDLYTLFTSMFLHAGWLHIIGNMLSLWIFADNIEAIVGSKLFLGLYVVGGLFASFCHVLSDTDSLLPMVGASGAIAAIMGTYIIMFPKSRVKTLIIFFPVYFPAVTFLGLWFVGEQLSGVGEIRSAGPDAGGVAYWAHIGGFVFGVIAGLIFKNKFGDKYSDTTV